MPPANDDFANAIVLTGTSGTNVPVDTFGATHETGEPDSPAATDTATVWYKFVAPYDGLLDIEIRGEGTTSSYWDISGIAAWIGTSLGTLVLRNSFDLPGYNNNDDALIILLPVKVDAGQTCYLQVSDGGDFVPDGVRVMNWRFITAPAWGEMDPPVGTGTMVTAMAAFGGAAFPTAPTVDNAIWDAPDDWKDTTGHATLEAQDLKLTVDAGAGSFDWVNLVYADAASADPEDPDFSPVTWSGPTEWQIGFQIENMHWHSFQPYSVTRWVPAVGFGSPRLGIDFSTANGGGYAHMIPYIDGFAEVICLEQDWLIKVKFVFHPTGGLFDDNEWHFHMSLDGGATWRFLAYDVLAPLSMVSECYLTAPNEDDASAWRVLYDGWGIPGVTPGPGVYLEPQLVG